MCDQVTELSFGRDDVLLDPLQECVACELSCCQVKHGVFLGIHRSTEFLPVHHQEDFHRSMSDTFIAVDEGVIENEREAERRRFGCKVWVEIHFTETLARLGKGRLKSVDISNSAAATPPFQDGLVKLQDFRKGEISSHDRR